MASSPKGAEALEVGSESVTDEGREGCGSFEGVI